MNHLENWEARQIMAQRPQTQKSRKKVLSKEKAAAIKSSRGVTAKKQGNKYRLNLPGIGEFGISQKDVANYISKQVEADMLQQKVNNLRNKIGVKNTHRTGILSGYTVDNPVKSSNFSKKDYARYHVNKLKEAFNVVNDGGTKSPKYDKIVGKSEPIRPKRKKTKKVKRNRVNITPIQPDPIKDVVNTMENTPAPGYVLTPAQQIAANVTNRILGPVQGGPPMSPFARPLPAGLPVGTTQYVESRPNIRQMYNDLTGDISNQTPGEVLDDNIYQYGGFMRW